MNFLCCCLNQIHPTTPWSLEVKINIILLKCITQTSKYIVCTPYLSAREGVEPPTKFSKSGDLKRPQMLEGVAENEWVTFFRGRELQFSHENKLKSEIFNDKKSL